MSDQCPHRPPCTACPRYGEPGLAAHVRLNLQGLAHAHGLAQLDIVDGALHAFRLRGRLAIRGRGHAPKLGLIEGGSHRVVHIPRCSIHHPLINATADTVRRALIDTGTPCYSDAAHLGIARYLQVVVERRTQTAQVVLVANSPADEPPAALLDCIRDRMGKNLHSLWFNSNQRNGNAILGEHFALWHGAPTVIENFGGADVHFGPGAFGQSNLAMAEQIIARIRDALTSQAGVAEFYAGVGAIGLSLLDRAARLHMNEMSAAGLEGLERGLAALPAEMRDRVRLFGGAAGDAVAATEGCDVVIVDPPRKGLDGALREHLVAAPPAQLLYVSCGIESLLADAAALTTGALRLSELVAFNQFPFTEHVETLARFERR